MNLLQWTAKVIDKQPYNLGKVDCFRMVVDFALNVKGIKFPYQHKGITIDDYADHYERDEEKTIAVVMDYFKTHLREIPIHKSIPGDVMVTTHRKADDHIFFGINGGNGKVVTVIINCGTKVVEQTNFNIIKAFTWAT